MLTESEIDTLQDYLDSVTRYANRTCDAPVREVNRPYQKMVEKAEQFDTEAKELGLKLCGNIETGGETAEFFWKNELWTHSDFAVENTVKTILNTLYSTHFAYELRNAYDGEEKVDMARFALSETQRKNKELETLRTIV